MEADWFGMPPILWGVVGVIALSVLIYILRGDRPK